MTIIEAINRVDQSKRGNTYSKTDKIAWLSKLDWMVKRHIIDTHDGGEDVVFDGYDADTDEKTELLAPPPYDEMYLRWLEAQIDRANDENESYNASIILFNTEYDAFECYYNREHLPKQAGNRFVW